MKKLLAMILAMAMMMTMISALAESGTGEGTANAAENVLSAQENNVESAADVAAAAAATAAADAQKLDASYTLALNAIAAEDYENAKEYINICFAYCDAQSNPVMFSDLLLKRGCIDVIEGKNDMALLNLDAALRIQPSLADAYLVRAQVNIGQGDLDRAVADLEQYITLTGDTSLYETIAQLQEAKGDINAAKTAYDQFVAGAGAEVEEAGFQAGLYRMQAGQFEDAIAAFTAYAENETYAAGALYNIGVCRMNLGDFVGAVESFTACEEKGGLYEGLYYNRGICRLLSENWEGAAADFTKSIETEPYVSDAQYNLGICKVQQGILEEAIASFTTLIEADEKFEKAEGTPVSEIIKGAHYYRALCRAGLNDLEGAVADFTFCIDQGYELGQSYYQRAQVYAAQGDTEKQNSDLQNSLKYSE